MLLFCRAFRHAGDEGRVGALQPLVAEKDLDILAGHVLIVCQCDDESTRCRLLPRIVPHVWLAYLHSAMCGYLAIGLCNGRR